jgi:hypothetical protein
MLVMLSSFAAALPVLLPILCELWTWDVAFSYNYQHELKRTQKIEYFKSGKKDKE